MRLIAAFMAFALLASPALATGTGGAPLCTDMSWIQFGNVIVFVFVSAALVSVCVYALRSLSHRPILFLVMFSVSSLVATIVADKTNGVNNLPPMPMPPRSAPIVATVTEEDVARGWRVECVTTNETLSYAMPSNAVYVSNWHIHGARSSFGRNVVDFGSAGTPRPTGWSFPLGTNGAAFSSFWYFVDGRIRPKPKDAAREICAVGVPMSAVPGKSRLWAMADGDSRVLTWENFFLGGDTNAPVNAQIRLFANGDFTTCSNDVETVCRRVNPDDWDGDGLANPIDYAPYVNNGDCFGTGEGWWLANSTAVVATNACPSAYYLLSFTATTDNTRIDIKCDGASDLGDFIVIANNGQNCEVPLLKGANYSLLASAPLTNVVLGDENAELLNNGTRGTPLGATSLGISYPLVFSFVGSGDMYTLTVVPTIPGMGLCSLSGGCCSQVTTTNGFAWLCSTVCTCGGTSQTLNASATWEGYTKEFSCGVSCGCGQDSPTPIPEAEPQNGSYAASVSASFGNNTIIFEDAYENTQNAWVGRRSTASVMTIHAIGGPNGGTLSVGAENLGKLQKNSGPAFPTATIQIPAGKMITYEMNYVGIAPSDILNDIEVTATLTEEGTGNVLAATTSVTVVKIELQAANLPVANPCLHRHVFGVDELVYTHVSPTAATIVWRDGVDIDVCANDRDFYCPWTGGDFLPLVTCGDASFNTVITTVEPVVVCRAAEWDGVVGTNGVAGNVLMMLHMFIEPTYVSFAGLYMEEIPDDTLGGHDGYFDDQSKGGPWSHTQAAGAGVWEPVQANGYWTTDHAAVKEYVRPWSNGWKVWNIPIGWGLIGSLKGRIQPNPTVQRFEITEGGTVTIQKHGHTIIRATDNKVWLDGNRVN